jgi:hypothetical protein
MEKFPAASKEEPMKAFTAIHLERLARELAQTKAELCGMKRRNLLAEA